MSERRYFLDQLNEIAQHFIGSECWSSIGGGSAGSLILASFGERIPLKHESGNMMLTEEERRFRGEGVIAIKNVPWRIETSEVVIGSWNDDAKVDGLLVKNLKLLVGKSVKDIRVNEPSFDLTIDFSEGLQLKVFCDRLRRHLGGNYSIDWREKRLDVSPWE